MFDTATKHANVTLIKHVINILNVKVILHLIDSDDLS